MKAGVPWGFLLTLTLAIAVVVGAVRFSYAPLLPPMREALSLTYTQAGLLGTANFVGYLIGSVTAAWWTERFGLSRGNAATIGLTAVALALAATTIDFWTGAGWRLFAGVTSGWTFVLTSSLVISRAPPGRTAFYTGIVYGGAGLGTVIAGTIIAATLAGLGPANGWRWGWVFLALASAIVAGIAWAGRDPRPQPGAAGAAPAPGSLGNQALIRDFLRRPAVLSPLIAYFLFAAGYIIYGTFYVAYLVQQGVDSVAAGWIWSFGGVLAIVSGALWGALAARFDGRRALVVAFAIEAGAVVLPILFPNPISYVASVAAYGLTVFGIPSILMSFTRTAVEPANIPRAVGIFTVVFSVGQMIGPATAGVVIDAAGGGIAPALILGAAILLTAAVSLAPAFVTRR